jgi:bifunctional non-homologous end joining protein LigD
MTSSSPASPTLAAKPPSGPDWVHEIKHDGYWLIVRRDGKAVDLWRQTCLAQCTALNR